MNQRTNPLDFAELTSLKLSAPLLLLAVLALLNWQLAVGLGFAWGAAGGLIGSYFSWLHLQKLSENLAAKSKGQLQRSAFSGTLAGVALMAMVVAISAMTPWLNMYAAAAGLFATKLFIGLTPFLRGEHGRDR